MTTIAVASGKGSPGTTFVAVNLSAALARRGAGVCLVDVDVTGGDVGAYLGLDPRKGLHALSLISGHRPVPEELRAELQYRFDFGVVGGVNRPATQDLMDPDFVAESSKVLARTVLLDVGRIPGPGLGAARLADALLLVVRPDVVSVRGAERALAVLEEAGVKKDTIRLVVNGHRRRRLGDVSDIALTLRSPIAGVIPWSATSARRALETQNPTGGTIARAFTDLAATIAPEQLTVSAAPGEVTPVGV